MEIYISVSRVKKVQHGTCMLPPNDTCVNDLIINKMSVQFSFQVKGKLWLYEDFPGGSDNKESAYNVGDLGLIPRLGRSPGEGNDNPLQYSCLGNPIGRGAWRTIVHRVTKSQTLVSNFNFHFFLDNYIAFLHFFFFGMILVPHGQRSLAGYSPWGRKGSTMTERLTVSLSEDSRLSLES